MEINYIKKEAHFTFIWKIAISDPCFGIYKSPEFIVESMEMTKWYLIYKLERCQNADFADDGWAYLSIQRVDDVPKEIEIKFEFSFLAPNGSSIIKKSRSKVFRKNGQSQPLSFSKIDEIFQEERDQFCPNGVLTIRCQIWRKNTEISKFELFFASSSFCVHKYLTVWAVKRFSSLQHKEERFRILNSNTEGGPKLILSVSLAEINGKKKRNH